MNNPTNIPHPPKTNTPEPSNSKPNSTHSDAPNASQATLSNSTDTIPTATHLTFWQTLSSVLYAMLGVQGRKNAQASLEKGRIGMFILVGLLVAGCFVLIVALVAYLAITSR
ncbi:DUF2970 domain-containing protein [Alkalimarinus sediminis]|uniref:DUF2970 domain-containing protein n=1 Tax=Alkalimarinus sediminis TaxID=1632866 RepID=A0A9E8HIA9_9ALTE|nr:DUF2970 domain-containing protein [Alkalimarinus sediminis]UZW74875.1 DUF2970 domain-containing protein [Alkalimarinus sediminis]